MQDDILGTVDYWKEDWGKMRPTETGLGPGLTGEKLEKKE